jgi:hypothetical protein
MASVYPRAIAVPKKTPGNPFNGIPGVSNDYFK